MTIRRMDSEEESLFRSYPYALYFVQSPSAISHANSAELRHTTATLDSPTRSTSDILNHHHHHPTTLTTTTQRLALSHYSSSRGSSNSFLHEKKTTYDVQSHGTGAGMEEEGGDKCFRSVDKNGELDGEEYYDESGGDGEDYEYFWRERDGGWWRYFSFRNSSSCAWISLQIGLRVLVSLAVAMLVFYLATKPPPPELSIKMGRIGEFGLGEGVDGSGVSTKILNCNCTLELLIDNKSKLFGLHIHPPLLSLSFANLPLAISRGAGELYASSDDKTSFKLYVGTRNKPMYGAGRSMQDMLETKKGLSLVIRVSLRSSFHVVWKLINSKFHHQVECFLVISRAYDKKHRTQVYNSRCIQTS